MRSDSPRLAELQAFIDEDPSDIFAHYALGLEYLSLEEPQQALEAFTEVRRRDPSYLANYYQWGKACEAVGQPEQARVAYEEGMVVAMQVGDWHTHEELETALRELG